MNIIVSHFWHRSRRKGMEYLIQLCYCFNNLSLDEDKPEPRSSKLKQPLVGNVHKRNLNTLLYVYYLANRHKRRRITPEVVPAHHIKVVCPQLLQPVSRKDHI